MVAHIVGRGLVPVLSWTVSKIADLTGQVFVVTGANSGVGFETSKVLVEHGGHVVMACRDVCRSQQAYATVVACGNGTGTGTAELLALDLADLDSVAMFAQELATRHPRVNGLINNAGVMGGPRKSTTQGFELQMGTNHLGHFALTAQIWPLLQSTDQPRIVSLSSLAARHGMLTPSMTESQLIDPQPYSAFPVYSNNKQAALLFSQELHRRATAAGVGIVSVAAHPGISSTNLFNRQLRDRKLGALVPIATAAGRVVFQSPRAAAQPSLRAATDVTVPSGAFVGPGALGQTRGAPVVLPLYPTGADPATAARLWELSELITRVSFVIA